MLTVFIRTQTEHEKRQTVTVSASELNNIKIGLIMRGDLLLMSIYLGICGKKIVFIGLKETFVTIFNDNYAGRVQYNQITFSGYVSENTIFVVTNHSNRFLLEKCPS